MELVRVHNDNIWLLQDFLGKAGNSLATFRYFAKRPYTVISRHLTTYLLCDNDEPLCYGHLDPENEKVWLGVAVSEKWRGRGLGRAMMGHLIGFARSRGIDNLHLSVDRQNEAAIALYHGLGFVPDGEKDNVLFYTLKLGT